MTAIGFHVGDCVLLYNPINDDYDKLTLQRKLPHRCHTPPRWDAISDAGDVVTVSEYEIEHTPRAEAEIAGSIIVALGVIGVLVAAAFGMGMV